MRGASHLYSSAVWFDSGGSKKVFISDQTLSKLAAKVVKDLVDEGDTDDENNSAPSQPLLPNFIIENAINRIATRRNYGIEDGPAALCLWRFEVNDVSMLSEKDRDLAAKRTSERVQVGLTCRPFPSCYLSQLNKYRDNRT